MKHAGQRGGHQSLAETDDVTENDTAAFFQMPGRNANGSGLKFQQGAAHIRRDGELGQSGTGFFRQVIGHLDVNLIGRRTFRPRPTFVNHLDEFLGDVHAPMVFPAIFKPACEFFGGVVVEDIHVEFALMRQTRKREIARTEKPRDGIVGVGAEAEIKFGVERVTEEKFHDNFACFQLRREATKAGFIGVCWRAKGELGAKFFRKTPLQTDDGLLTDLILLRQETVSKTQFVLGEPLHSDEKATLRTITARPFLNEAINRLPAAQIEVADAEI